MDDDDPFAVVAPKEKKMSTYLKKSKEPSANRCVETSSHGTNSTRSTTNSTIPPEDSNAFLGKSHDPLSRKTTNSSGFNNSGSSGSTNFDFGNGLEFGQGFGSSGFDDDGFGLSSSGGNKGDRKAQSSRNFLSAAPDPFMDAPAAPKSMRNFSSGDDFDAFGTSKPKISQSVSNFGSTDAFDAFGSSDPFHDMDSGFAPFEEEDEDVKFGSEFDTTFQDFGSAGAQDAWAKREHWKQSGRSKGGEAPKRNQSTLSSSGQRRRGGIPRRAQSSNDGFLPPSSGVPSPRDSARKKHTDKSPHLPQKSRDKSPRHLDNSDHSPVRRTRSGRRATMDHSGHTETSGDKSHGSEPRRRPPRRGSVGYTSTDGASDNKVPTRNKSSSGPAHRPAGGRKQRSVSHTSSSGSLDFMQMNLPKKEGDDDPKEADFDHEERAKNQQKIMDMFSGGVGLSSKSERQISDSSLGDIGKQIDIMALTDEQSQASGGTSSSRSRLRRGGRKKEKEEDDDGYKEPKDRTDRTKGSLLDRVVGDSSHDVTPRTGGNSSSGGMSYSDRIMEATQRSKRN